VASWNLRKRRRKYVKWEREGSAVSEREVKQSEPFGARFSDSRGGGRGEG